MAETAIAEIPLAKPETARDQIQSLMEQHGLSISAEFVPFSRSRNAKPRNGAEKPWRSLNWCVTLHQTRVHSDDTRSSVQILATDYSAGEAYCPAAKAPMSDLGSRHDAISREIETGRRTAYPHTPIMPDSVDVLHSLVADSDVLDHPSFESWASDLGYDTDSRSAEATYRECLAVALALRNGIGETAFAALREACQDY